MWKAELHMEEANRTYDLTGADRLSVTRQADVRARNLSGIKTVLRHEIAGHNSIIYTDGVGIIGYVNYWEDNGR